VSDQVRIALVTEYREGLGVAFFRGGIIRAPHCDRAEAHERLCAHVGRQVRLALADRREPFRGGALPPGPEVDLRLAHLQARTGALLGRGACDEAACRIDVAAEQGRVDALDAFGERTGRRDFPFRGEVRAEPLEQLRAREGGGLEWTVRAPVRLADL